MLVFFGHVIETNGWEKVTVHGKVEGEEKMKRDPVHRPS